MSGVPAGFKEPDYSKPETWGKTAAGGSPWQGGTILRPTAGSHGSMYVEFVEVRDLNGAESEEQGIEIYDKKEVLHVRTDKFSNVPIAVGKPGVKKDKAVLERQLKSLEELFSNTPAETADEERIRKAALAAMSKANTMSGVVRSEMSIEQKRALAPLYERFKEQKGSTDTHINTWQALNDGDRAFLGGLGIFTIEQLYHTPADRRNQFGPGGQELWERSERFMKAKQQAADTDERRAELALIRAEREQDAKEKAEMREQMFELQAQIAKLSEGKSNGTSKRT